MCLESTFTQQNPLWIPAAADICSLWSLITAMYQLISVTVNNNNNFHVFVNSNPINNNLSSFETNGRKRTPLRTKTFHKSG